MTDTTYCVEEVKYWQFLANSCFSCSYV